MNSSMEMQVEIGIGPQLVIMGTILGSLFVGIFTFSITENIPLGESSSHVIGPQAVNDHAETSASEVTAENQIVAEDQVIQDQEHCPVSTKFPESILQWCTAIGQYSSEYGLSPDLVAAVMLQESGGNPDAYSKSGAVGLMQVMPRDGIAASFMCVNGPCFSNRPAILELQDPEFNIEYGTRMLANLQRRYGDIRDALKSYGPMDVGYTYADKVLAIFENYQE